MHDYILSQHAQKDWESIAQYTLKNHRQIQLKKYTNQLETCINALIENKPPFKKLDEIYKNLRVKPCHHHYIFALAPHNKPLLIIAIFYERMDLMQKLKNRLQ